MVLIMRNDHRIKMKVNIGVPDTKITSDGQLVN